MLPHVLVVRYATERELVTYRGMRHGTYEQTTVLTCSVTCSEPFGTVCKRKLDCNTVRFKKFVMSHHS